VTPIRLVHLVLLGVTTAAAVTVSRKDKHNWPVAWYLVAVVALDLVRLGLRQLLPNPPPAGQLEGWDLLLRHIDQAAYLGLIMVVPAMNMALFLRKRPWAIGVVFVAVCAVLTGSYPAIRGNELLEIYTAIELAGVVASAGFFIMWLRSPRLLEEGASVPIMSGVVLTSGNLVTVVLPPLTGAGVLTKWPIVVALHAVCFGIVLVFQLRYLLTKKGKV